MENITTTKQNNNFLLSINRINPNPSFRDNSGKQIRMNDFDLAVTLFHTGARLLSVEEDSSGELIFIFKKICNLQDFTEEFDDDLLTVKSFSFLQSIKAFGNAIDKHLNKNNPK